MSSIPSSRYLVYPIPWYSFLIVVGVVLAICLAVREEKRHALPRDTILDLSLWILPFGIIGARLYYVLFSWDQFRDDPVSVLRVWEGGIAIYGAVIAGLIVLILFCRNRRLSPLLLCDLIAPGLVLAQSIGRWGNYFNIEAFGWKLTDPALCFFPLAVQVPAEANAWHLATFFYESVADMIIFIFLVLTRRKLLNRQGDVFMFYLYLYAAARLVIEELRLDSLYASSVRISQLLSVILCMIILVRFVSEFMHQKNLPAPVLFLLFPLSLLFSIMTLVCMLTGLFFRNISPVSVLIWLLSYSIFMIVTLFVIFLIGREGRRPVADDKI